MRAHVARHARRALVRPLSSPAWRPLTAPTPRLLPAHLQYRSRRQCRRTFIASLFQKPPRDVRETEYEPGWMEIMVWRSRMLDNLQPPSRQELIEAWNKFMQYKILRESPLNRTQAIQCRRLLEYLSQSGPSLDSLFYNYAFEALALPGYCFFYSRRLDSTSEHAELARALHTSAAAGTLTFTNQLWRGQYEMLIVNGEVDLAMTMLSDQPEHTEAAISELWFVRDAFLQACREEHVLRLLEPGISRRAVQKRVEWLAVIFYARRDRVQETLDWVDKVLKMDGPNDQCPESLHPAVLYDLAIFATRNGQERWAIDLIQHVADHQQLKPTQWAALASSRLRFKDGLEAAKTILSRMTVDGEVFRPNVEIINAMLIVAKDLEDEHLANQITGLAADEGILPDQHTFYHWMDIKIRAGDITGARFAFNRARDAPPMANKAAESFTLHATRRLLNDFLLLLSSQSRPDFPYIAELLEDNDDEVRLEPQTVAQLSLRFLENEQYFEVMDLMAIYAFKYGENERQVLQTALSSFCRDPNVSTARAWSAYQILEQYFPDLEIPERLKLMEELFRRKRPDMALKLFAAMRNHRSPSYRPDEDAYRLCFEGLARNPDLESTQQVNDFLKTDTGVQPSTRLFTALMLAYTAAGRPLTALDYWKEITTGKEGPSYASLAAVFWALENRPTGATMARDIWTRLERMDVEVPVYVYNAYVGSIAGSGHVTETQRIITRMATYVGSEPDAMTLGIAYNALPEREKQKEFEEWAKTMYRQQWAVLERSGRRLNTLSLCQFKIQRPLKA